MTTSGRRVAIGVQPHVTTRTMGILDVARHVADRGLASIFLCEHTHVPVDSARSESPLRRFPEWIKYMLDPYVALSFVAATTELEVGTAVGLPAQHDPIALAKAIATLDHLSGGRFVFGVGWGWLREDFEDHGGTPANQRGLRRVLVQVSEERMDRLEAVLDEAAGALQ